LAHGVVAVVGAVELVVGIDVEAVGAPEEALAPAPDEVAVAVEHDHRVVAAIEHVDAVLAIDPDGTDVGQIPSVGKLGPVLDDAIAVFARTQEYRGSRLGCATRTIRDIDRHDLSSPLNRLGCIASALPHAPLV